MATQEATQEALSQEEYDSRLKKQLSLLIKKGYSDEDLLLYGKNFKTRYTVKKKDESDSTSPSENSESDSEKSLSDGTQKGTFDIKPTPKEKIPSDTSGYKEKINNSRKGVRQNEDGTVSSHLMASSEWNGKFIAYPTLFQKEDGTWYEPENAWDEAKEKDEVYSFDTNEEAEAFAKGSWKPEESTENTLDEPYNPEEDTPPNQELLDVYDKFKNPPSKKASWLEKAWTVQTAAVATGGISLLMGDILGDGDPDDILNNERHAKERTLLKTKVQEADTKYQAHLDKVEKRAKALDKPVNELLVNDGTYEDLSKQLQLQKRLLQENEAELKGRQYDFMAEVDDETKDKLTSWTEEKKINLTDKAKSQLAEMEILGNKMKSRKQDFDVFASGIQDGSIEMNEETHKQYMDFQQDQVLDFLQINTALKEFEDSKEGIQTFEKELEIFKRNYGFWANKYGRAKLTMTELSVGTLQKLAELDKNSAYVTSAPGGYPGMGNTAASIEGAETTFDKRTQANVARFERIQAARDLLRPDIKVTDLKTPSDFLRWSTDAGATQSAIIATMMIPGAGYTLLGAGTAGQKELEMRSEMKNSLGLINYTDQQLALASWGYGVFEMGFEYMGTGFLLRQGKRTLKAMKAGKVVPPRTILNLGAEGFTREVGTELATTAGQLDLIDIAYLGKEVSAKERADAYWETVGQAGFMGFGLGTGPVAVGRLASHFVKVADSKILKDRADKIGSLVEALDSGNLNKEQRAIIEAEIKMEMTKQEGEFLDTATIVENLDGKEIKEVLVLNEKIAEGKANLKAVEKSEVQEGAKKLLVDKIKQDIVDAVKKKEAILQEGTERPFNNLTKDSQQTHLEEAKKEIEQENKKDGTGDTVVDEAKEKWEKAQDEHDAAVEKITNQKEPNQKETDKLTRDKAKKRKAVIEAKKELDIALDEEAKVVRKRAIENFNKEQKKSKINESKSPTEKTTEDKKSEVLPNENKKGESVKDKKVIPLRKVKAQVRKAKKALSLISPKTKIIVHPTQEAYNKASSDGTGRGEFNYKDNTIHINGEKAVNSTVGHEVFHAILLGGLKSNVKAVALTKKMIGAVNRSLKDNPEMKKYLNDFAKNYEKYAKNEEKLAELVGVLAENYQGLSVGNKSLVRKWIDQIANLLGWPQLNDTEVIDFLNTIAGKVATGEALEEGDVGILKKDVRSPIDKFSEKGLEKYIDYLDEADLTKKQAESLFTEETPVFKNLGDVTKFLDQWIAKNKLFNKSIDEVSDKEVIRKFAAHVYSEIKTWEEVKGDKYVGFYDEDIPLKLNPELQKFAQERYGRKLKEEEVSLYHIVSSFASPSADPKFDSSKGLEVFDKYMTTGELTPYGTDQATIWATDKKGKRYDTGKPKFDSEGKPIFKQIAKAYSVTSLNKVNVLLNKFNGNLKKTIDWIESHQSYIDGSAVAG